MSFKLEIKNLDVVIKNFDKAIKDSTEGLQAAIDGFVVTVEEEAKQLAPADTGYLHQNIFKKIGKLEGSVISRADYSAYQEFGTRSFAAARLATYPADWKAFAARFKGLSENKLAKGIKGKPFLYPAFTNPNTLKQFKEDLEDIYK